MSTNHISTKLKNMTYNGTMVKKWYHDGVLVFSAGSTVTYHVDSSTKYTEEVYNGASCLSPKTFTPTKSGWTFVGWRDDKTASSSVLSSKVMGTNPITLYAVFKQTVTVTYYNNSTSASTTSDSRYYNNGNILNPKLTLAQASKSGWTARGWSKEKSGNASVLYSSINNTEIAENITLYGLYQQDITVTYYNNSTTASTAKGIRYYNSVGNYTEPSFTLTQASVSGWTARGWSTGTTGNSSVTYNNNTAFTRNSNITLYGMYSTTITLSYNGNGSTSGSTASHTGTAYRNYAGSVIGATFTLKSNGFTKTNYTFTKWASGSISGTQYAVGASVTLSANTTFYALWVSASTPYTWVDNYVGSGASLTISITGGQNCKTYPVGSTVSSFNLVAVPSDGTKNWTCAFKTNSVSTKGCKYMTIYFNNFHSNLNDGSGGLEYFRIKSSDGTTLATYQAQQLQVSKKVDVSSVSEVYIEGNFGGWAYSGQMPCSVQSISFGDS